MLRKKRKEGRIARKEPEKGRRKEAEDEENSQGR